MFIGIVRIMQSIKKNKNLQEMTNGKNYNEKKYENIYYVG